MNNILIFILTINILFAMDNDFDGVEDDIDQCLNTSFKYLVDKKGCPIGKTYFGNIDLEIGKNTLEEKYLFFDYDYNNILISYTNILDKENDYYSISGGYKLIFKRVISKIYYGKDEYNDFIEVDVDYYKNNFIYFSSYKSLFNGMKDMQNYTLGSSYSKDEQKVTLSYLNNDNTYEDITLAYSYDITSDMYIKLEYDYSVNDSNSIYFGVGVQFE